MTIENTSVPSPISADEAVVEYGLRLQRLGFDEMRIRKEILRHFPSTDLNRNRIFNSLSDARVRYITMIHQLNPAKTHKGLVRKLAATISISEEEAEESVSRYKEVGGMSFIPWTSRITD